MISPDMAWAVFMDDRCRRYARNENYRLRLNRERPGWNPRARKNRATA